MMGDVPDQKVPIPNLTITRILNQEKSPDLFSHKGFEAIQPSAESPMIINGKNIPLLDVFLFHFYPLDHSSMGGIRRNLLIFYLIEAAKLFSILLMPDDDSWTEQSYLGCSSVPFLSPLIHSNMGGLRLSSVT
nr:hypothetical protein [Tanacetum cinerariifolium]